MSIPNVIPRQHGRCNVIYLRRLSLCDAPSHRRTVGVVTLQSMSHALNRSLANRRMRTERSPSESDEDLKLGIDTRRQPLLVAKETMHNVIRHAP